jgi:hypothetical protein
LQSALHNAAALLTAQESGPLENTDVLQNGRQGHVKRLRERTHCLRAIAQLSQHRSPRGISQSGECGVEIGRY